MAIQKAQGEMHAQERPKKILSFHLKLIPRLSTNLAKGQRQAQSQSAKTRTCVCLLSSWQSRKSSSKHKLSNRDFSITHSKKQSFYKKGWKTHQTNGQLQPSTIKKQQSLGKVKKLYSRVTNIRMSKFQQQQKITRHITK